MYGAMPIGIDSRCDDVARVICDIDGDAGARRDSP